MYKAKTEQTKIKEASSQETRNTSGTKTSSYQRHKKRNQTYTDTKRERKMASSTTEMSQHDNDNGDATKQVQIAGDDSVKKEEEEEQHTKCFTWMVHHRLGWLARLPGKWPRTFALILGVVRFARLLPLSYFAGSSFFTHFYYSFYRFFHSFS